MTFHEFIHLRPDQLKMAIEEFPLALIPLGSLEWHSYHLPLGMDGLKADALIKRIGEKMNKGVLFPCRWWGGIKTMKFPMTHEIPSFQQKRFFDNTIQWLYDMGFKVIILLTGHYPAKLTKILRKVSERFMQKHDDAYVFGLPEFLLLWDQNYFGDHAAAWETSISMALFPNDVDMGQLPDNYDFIERERKLGVMGKDPTKAANEALGKRVVDLFVSRMIGIIEKCWKEQSQQPIIDAYEEYTEAYGRLVNLKDLGPAMEILGMKEKKDFLRHGKWMIFERMKGDTKDKIENGK